MKQIRLGSTGPSVSALGLGCMPMSGVYGERDDTRSEATIRQALDLGITLFDTADIYGAGHNERLLGDVLRDVADEVVIADKFGIVMSRRGQILGVSNSPAYIIESCHRILSRLNKEIIDLLYLHRIDPRIPIEVSIDTIAGLIRAGKVRNIALSEASSDTIRRAGAVHPIAAVQNEYSIFSRDIESDVLPACRDVGAVMVAYSPLGRGLLTGSASKNWATNDVRRFMTGRLAGESLAHNLQLVERIAAIGRTHEASPAQVALAWLLSRGSDVVPIFGTTRPENVVHNVQALDLQLSNDELAELDSLSQEVAGNRLSDQDQATCRGTTPELGDADIRSFWTL